MESLYASPRMKDLRSVKHIQNKPGPPRSVLLKKTERLEEDEDEVEEEEERDSSCCCDQWDEHIETEEEDKKTAEGGKRGRDEREREKTDSGRKKETGDAKASQLSIRRETGRCNLAETYLKVFRGSHDLSAYSYAF
ncbi:hypothetical protein EYF80_018334 [Liparis tanakae]|uniref:Uncharacterized protein n=1 Tax=Liparis tanakae TaxID=230148 RepID=A0A4Z2I122_9TELE|nr:hypothetical protein EYF80_018334 [Liparis tanakae]